MHARRTRSILVLAASAMLVAAAACGGGDGGGGGPASLAPAQGKVTVTPETAATAFALAEGNYRVGWKTTDCKKVVIALEGDSGYTKEKSSTVPNFSFIATSVPAGSYTAAQTDPACTQWTLTIEKI